MSHRTRIYLDNAATSWPKPECVYESIDRYQRTLGAPAGRGAYGSVVKSTSLIERARTNIRRLTNVAYDAPVIFGLNGTDMLNLAIHGLLRKGDHVVLTDVDHNSVLRPVATLEKSGTISATHVPSDAHGVVSVDAILAAVEPATRLVAVPHASNVTGAIQPIGQLALAMKQRGLPAKLLVDAAQTMGHFCLDLQEMPIDILVSSGHKGLLGPLGTGLMILSAELVEHIHSRRQGGTGNSESPWMPTTAPEKYEAGSPNVPGLAGLAASVEFLLDNQDNVRAHEIQLTEHLLGELNNINTTTVYGPAKAEQRVGVVSFSVQEHNPHDVANILDTAHGIEVRAGLQCAPRMHRLLGTDKLGGTVRASLGPFNTEAQIESLVVALKELTPATASQDVS